MPDYTILSAYYANAERTAVIAMTQEAGAVVVSERDRPELWAQMLSRAIPIADMPNQPKIIDPGQPTVLSDGSDN
jgi:hypothetical protein